MKSKFIKLGIILSGLLLLCVLLIGNLPTGNSPLKEGRGAFSLTRPAFAQETATFPADEAGISAYVNVGQSIDLRRAKSTLRGIEAEGDNYVIGIMELTGLPEEEFPHIYISQDGWILAYYSKFAPASRIMQWYGYEGGPITTTTLQDAISKICTTMRLDYSKVRANMGYYHFKYPDATKLVLAVDTQADNGLDTLNYLIPYNITLYEGSGSLNGCGDAYLDPAQIHIDRDLNVFYVSRIGFQYKYLEDRHLTPGKNPVSYTHLTLPTKA